MDKCISADIDDILLFSSNHESHQQLLLDFFHIVQAHGIMLSDDQTAFIIAES